jgi:fucose 4-O-acetylase-like acetyltransferase
MNTNANFSLQTNNGDAKTDASSFITSSNSGTCPPAPPPHTQEHARQFAAWVDFAKVAAMYLVILGHFPVFFASKEHFVLTAIYSFHMPFFFFISGWLTKDYGIKETLRDSLKKLVIPYLSLCAILWVVHIFQNRSAIAWFYHAGPDFYVRIYSKFLFPFSAIMGGRMSVESSLGWWCQINGPLWFVVALFYMKLLHSLFLRIARKNLFTYTLLLLPVIVVCIILDKTGIKQFGVPIDSALLAFPFFALGSIARKKSWIEKIQPKTKDGRIWAFVTGFAGLVLLSIVQTNNWDFVQTNNWDFSAAGYIQVIVVYFSFGKSLFLFYAFALFGILSFIVFSFSFNGKASEETRTLSGGMLLILAFHMPVMEVLLPRGGNPLPLHDNILYSLFILLFFYIPIKLARRHCPFLLGHRKI